MIRTSVNTQQPALIARSPDPTARRVGGCDIGATRGAVKAARRQAEDGFSPYRRAASSDGRYRSESVPVVYGDVLGARGVKVTGAIGSTVAPS